MIDLRELRTGCHVLCGSIYNDKKIPNHYAKVVWVGEGVCNTVADDEQGDPDEYSDYELDPIEMYNIPTKLKTDAKVSQHSSWIKVSLGERYIVRNNVRYLHQLEGMLMDVGAEFHYE